MRFLPIYQGRYIGKIFSLVRNRLALVPAGFFFLYWILPLLLTAIPVNCSEVGGGAYTNCVVSRATSYLVDFVHLMFAITASLLAFFVYRFVLRVHIVVSEMATPDVEDVGRKHLVAAYKDLSSLPFRKTVTTLVFCVAIWFFAVFWHRTLNMEFSFWWGNIRNGVSGLYYCFAITIFVFLAAQYLFFVGCIGTFLIGYSRKAFSILPFHYDGVSGMSRVAKLVFDIWVQGAFMAACTLIVFYSNYLGIVDSWAVWSLAAIVVVVLPTASVLPVIILVMEGRNQKRKYASKVIQENFDVSPWDKTSFDPSRIKDFIEVRNNLSQVQIFPFRAWKILAIGAFNALQLYISVVTILEGVPSI